jgi:hypothetical protein
MPTYSFQGYDVHVDFSDQNFFLFRRQGVSINIEKSHSWWCPWCGGCNKNEIDTIQATASLRGLAGGYVDTQACGHCCSLGIYAPWYYGVNVPQSYCAASVEALIRIKGKDLHVRVGLGGCVLPEAIEPTAKSKVGAL